MSIAKLQKKIGVTADGVFGPATLKAAMQHFKLSKSQAAHFFGQCSHETGEFKVFSENLNYSSEGLQKTFKKYFPTKELADKYARKPALIASRVYANRMGNGDEASQDGFTFRGRGAIQLTGKDNYTKFGAVGDPDKVAEELAFDAAIWFFTENKLWSMCGSIDDTSITNLTKKINGGTNGLDHRKLLTKKYYSWL